MKVAVTGGTGLIGWHVSCALKALQHDVVLVERSSFASPNAMADVLHSVDAVVHAAGMNRGADHEIVSVNVELAQCIAAAMDLLPSVPRVLFTNSTHIERDTDYGCAKRRVADILREAVGENFTDLVLPGVFGERGRPFSNSVVSTFAHQLAVGEPMSINDDAEIELMHAQDVADVIIDALGSTTSGQIRLSGTVTSVAQLAHRMTELSSRYQEGVIPDIRDPFDRALFNTSRSYRFPDQYPLYLETHRDDRGSLAEVVRTDNKGQCFVSSTRPGVTRGNHFHRRKVERFVVIGGEAQISIRRLFATEVNDFVVSGKQPAVIDIPTLHTHNITNIGDDDLITFFWADELFDSTNPDTVFEAV